jgi:hypothetical protein
VIFFPNKHENLIINLKAVQTGSHRAELRAGAGAATNIFGSTTLHLCICLCLCIYTVEVPMCLSICIRVHRCM